MPKWWPTPGDDSKEIIIADTGGFYSRASDADFFWNHIKEHTGTVMEKSDILLFVVDCREGILPDDYQIIDMNSQTTQTFFCCRQQG